MFELERNSPIEPPILAEFFARCGWQESDAAAKLEWALAAADEWIVCRLDDQIVGFGRSCRLDAVNRVVFDAVVDPRFAGSGLRGEILRLLTENAGRLEKVSVYSEQQANLLLAPAPQDELEPVQHPSASSQIYLGRQRSFSGDDL